MKEWILIIVINVTTPQGEIRDISVETIKDFKTEKSCENALSVIAHKIGKTITNARDQKKIENQKSYHTIKGQCTLIVK